MKSGAAIKGSKRQWLYQNSIPAEEVWCWPNIRADAQQLAANQETERPTLVAQGRAVPCTKQWIGNEQLRTLPIRGHKEMAKNFYQYAGPGNQMLFGYERRYRKVQLR